jgi:DNA-binding transcriptional ArsR family regulator
MPKTLPVVDMSAPVCCSPVAAGPLDDVAALEIALRLKALADPVRVKLVSLLFSSSAGAVCSCDLAEAVGLSESTVSHHLSQLRRAGIVESERRGMNVYHRPRRDALTALCTVLDPNCCS